MQTDPPGSTADSRVLVVYDGLCGFCRGRVEYIRKRDRAGVFTCLSRHDPELTRRFPDRPELLTPGSMKVLLPSGRLIEGADAVFQIARRLPGWRWFVWMYLIPGLRQLGRLVYGWIARNRQRLGRGEVCDLPPRPQP